MAHQDSVDEDVHRLKEAVARFAMGLHNPANHARLQVLAGMDFDKLTEIVLCIVHREEDADLRLSDLARRLGVELSSVSRKVQKLEDVGLIERTSDPRDARASRLRMTPAGHEVVERVSRARVTLIEHALSEWTTKDRRSLAVLLERFVDDITSELEGR